jgi:hypothetical protein
MNKLPVCSQIVSNWLASVIQWWYCQTSAAKVALKPGANPRIRVKSESRICGNRLKKEMGASGGKYAVLPPILSKFAGLKTS